MTVIYADLVLGLNIVLDWTLLRMTARLRGIRPERFRIAGAALIGTVYAGVLFLPTVPFLLTIGGKVLISICMLMVAFGFHQFGYFFRNLLAFYFSAFVIAGGAMGIQYLLQDASLWSVFSNTASEGVSERMKFGSALLIIGLCCAYGLYRIAWGQQKQQSQMNTFLAEVEIGIGGQVCTCKGLIDTGNSLKEPLSGAPVMITDAMLWDGILPASWITAVQEGDVLNGLQQSEDDGSSAVDAGKLRIIPYRGVNASTQWMIGFKPDYIKITHDASEYRVEHAVVGLDSGRLSADQQFQAILHPDMIDPSLKTVSTHSGSSEALATKAS
ncbi:sigma-E processing peptidase SpoIIGA [Paenibacillus sp. 1001270B_150601_E10]|uniref:sigma-E processing peptidase SpoIIGA n=1 Tax=Paenibacillus sp. 1001270B_150601_E10 TaxID=2787079 RepID=UPI0018A0CD25|nr:sigma-E processing peptidase SpoIIGA [Paenibacillus sp. 1001270B_150601_E10]